jgi:hypothetical protein
MMVTKKDGSRFKVCADGEKPEIKAFFEEALAKWKENGINKRIKAKQATPSTTVSRPPHRRPKHEAMPPCAFGPLWVIE